MPELTGSDSLLRGIGLLYLLLAFGAIGFAIWKGETWKSKVLWAGIWIAVFGLWPAKVTIDHAQRQAYAREAWAYFKKKCATEAGEKIYKTFTGVKSVLVIKPLPPATEKDLYDQFWYGDPYSNDSAIGNRGERVASLLIGRVEFSKNLHAQDGFDFIEQRVENDGDSGFQRIYPLKDPPFTTKSEVVKPGSRFGISWEDVSTPNDRKFWVAGSRLRIFDLTDNSIVAERVGYVIEAGFGSTESQRRPWQSSRGPNTTCPSLVNRDFSDRWFILKVLNPSEGGAHGK